jgi:hypothetical protein
MKKINFIYKIKKHKFFFLYILIYYSINLHFSLNYLSIDHLPTRQKLAQIYYFQKYYPGKKLFYFKANLLFLEEEK